MCQNTPQLCWGDEWPPFSPGGREGGNDLIVTPTVTLLDKAFLCNFARKNYISNRVNPPPSPP